MFSYRAQKVLIYTENAERPNLDLIALSACLEYRCKFLARLYRLSTLNPAGTLCSVFASLVWRPSKNVCVIKPTNKGYY